MLLEEQFQNGQRESILPGTSFGPVDDGANDIPQQCKKQVRQEIDQRRIVVIPQGRYHKGQGHRERNPKAEPIFYTVEQGKGKRIDGVEDHEIR